MARFMEKRNSPNEECTLGKHWEFAFPTIYRPMKNIFPPKAIPKNNIQKRHNYSDLEKSYQIDA